MLLLEHKPLIDPNITPTAPIEIWTEGILEETVISWIWHDGNDGIFKRGWFGMRELNFEHPYMIASIKKSHQEQQECLKRKPTRYPFWM